MTLKQVENSFGIIEHHEGYDTACERIKRIVGVLPTATLNRWHDSCEHGEVVSIINEVLNERDRK